MDFEKYSTLLNGTVVPAGLSDKEYADAMNPLQNYIWDNMPHKLYKYRSCNENHMNAFYNNQIWVASAKTMNDGFDARLYFNRNEALELIKSQMSEDKIKLFIDTLRNDSDLQSNISKLPGGKEALENMFIPDEIIEASIISTRNKLITDVAYTFNVLSTITQQTMKFCSLSENVRSASMWGQYSENETGFCLEYDFSDRNAIYFSPSGKPVNCTLYPVLYEKERYTVPSSYIEYLIRYKLFAMIAAKSGDVKELNKILSVDCPDLFMITKIALHKSVEWEYEKEWRLFCNSSKDSAFENATHGCFYKKPTALFLGRRISELNEKILVHLAEEKRIPVYKMRLNDTSPTYELEYKQIKG